MKYTSRADLLIAAGISIKMQNKYSIDPVCKVYGELRLIEQCSFMSLPVDIEFPLAVVEGKPVFVGDELHERSGIKFTAQSVDFEGWIVSAGREEGDDPLKCSWNPPKSKTVMVELLRDDIQFYIDNAHIVSNHGRNLIAAFRKALEKA